MHRDEICTVKLILEELTREDGIKMTVGYKGLRVGYRLKDIL
jgi:hypothetical protein